MIYLEGEIDAALAFHLLPRTAAAGLPNGSRQTPKQHGRKSCGHGADSHPARTGLLACPLFSRFNSGFAHQRRGCRT